MNASFLRSPSSQRAAGRFSNTSINELQCLSCGGEIRKLLALMIMLCAAILFFQHVGLQDDNEIIVPIPENPSVDTSKPDHPALAPGQDGNFTWGQTRSPPSNAPMSKLNSTTGSSQNNISQPLPPPPPLPPKLEIPSKFSARKVYAFKEIGELLTEGHRSSHSMVPLWSTKADRELIHVKSEIEKADDDPAFSEDLDGLYGPLYHNVAKFKRSYELMEKTLKIYIYKEGDKPMFHQPILTGTYASEGWFMKQIESDKQFVTKNPEEAHLFYIPFSSLQMRTLIPNTPQKKSYIDFLKNYLDMVADKYPYWNRTGGADHFFAACQDWFESITRSVMPTCIRALCDADIYKRFSFGKDVSLVATMVYNPKNPLQDLGGKPPTKRKTLAFFTGRMTGYFRPVLMEYWENVDPDIKMFTGSPRVNGSKGYVSYMRDSKYCLCPRGTLSFSPRVVESIYHGCVPVLISDNYIPPFSDVLDWESFSVFMAEKDVPKLKEILVSIPEEKYLRLYERGKMVQRHFLWHPDQPVKYDVFHMILHSVWQNRVFQFQPNESSKQYLKE